MKLLIMAALIWGQTAGGAQTDAPTNPIADPRAVVTAGHARFTVLTPAMIRMEWSAKHQFENRASFAFVNRRLDVPEFTTSREGDWTVIKTRELTLRYRADGGRFAKDNLSVELQCAGKPVKWTPGMPDTGNLRGTTRTLDGVSGSCELEPGLLSRDGWVVVDDSKRLLFDSAPSPPHADATAVGMAPSSSAAETEQPWVATRKDPDAIDWYFFGYGHDYKRALFDFTRVGGKIPLPPRFVFGAWWSRYWAYSDAELRQLVKEFDDHDVPLDVLVVDMDWHLDGWTGYTWNPKYFPDPKSFLDWAHKKGLKVTLNLHPADGVGKHEAAFPEFAKAMGLDPAKTDRIPFDCTDRKYMDAYFKLLHHPLEKMGIDFWWMDWQQGTGTKVAGLDPLFWLNHLHWNDMARNPDRSATHRTHHASGGGGERGADATTAAQSTSQPATGATGSSTASASTSAATGSRDAATQPVAGAYGRDQDARLRPLIFSRWGGLGNHRYPIGFSGDTYCNWESLAFQPYFTATAGNVGYAYWSHDIGGHQPGKVDPELYVRWIQWGALSPILRTHTTKNPEAERRIWEFPEEYFLAAREAYRLRYQLLPYVYTMARKTYDTGMPLCRPLYYEWPELDEAYSRTGQYMFGDDLLVAPVTAPSDPMTGCANVEVWIPPGKWTNWFTGRRYEGPRIARLLVPLKDIPLFVRDGGVIPMISHKRRIDRRFPERLGFNVFPGGHGEAQPYFDDGITDKYLNTGAAWIPVDNNHEGDVRTLSVGPIQGECETLPEWAQFSIKDWALRRSVNAVKVNGLTAGRESPNLPFCDEPLFYGGFEALGPNFNFLGVSPVKKNTFVIDTSKGTRDVPDCKPEARSLIRTFYGMTTATQDVMEENSTPYDPIDAQVSIGQFLTSLADYKEFGVDLVGDWFEIRSDPQSWPFGLDLMKGIDIDSPRFVVRWLGLFHQFRFKVTQGKEAEVNTELLISPTLPLVDFGNVECEISFDAGPGVKNYENPRVFDGLTEDKPVVAKTAITTSNNIDAIRLTANVTLTKGGDSVAFPFSRTLFPSINHWWIVGPFEATFEKGLATEYPPEGEKAFDAAAKYDGKGRKNITWQRVSRVIKAGDDPTCEHFVDLNKLYGSPGDAVAYGMSYLDAPADMDATLAIGSDDGAAVWLNGAEVYRQDVGRAYTSKQDRVPVKLKKGLNPLLIKVKQGTGGWGFCVHVENEKGEPLPEVKAVLER